MSNFVHLHVHSEYSILDGMSTVKEIVDKAVSDGQQAVAITDHGHMGSVPDFYSYAREKGIKPIIGQEFYIVPDCDVKIKNEYPKHIVLLALNRRGYEILCQLSSEAAKNFYYRPRIDHKMLIKFHSELDNIVALSGCMSGEIASAILANKPKYAERLLKFYNTIFPNFYLEFMEHGYDVHDDEDYDENEIEFSDNEQKINKQLYKFHEQYGIPLVVTNDSHYLSEDDEYYHDVLLAIQTGSKYSDSNRFSFNGGGYNFTTSEEMCNKVSKKLWRKSERSMADIISMVDIQIPELENNEHFIPSFGSDDADGDIKEICMEGINSLVVKRDRKRYIKELNYQLGIIEECGFADEFLIVEDYVRAARKMGNEVGARGSMVGVLVSYLMRITDVDPIRFNLSFERALNPARPSLPDFDMDFADKDKVIRYLRDKYGADNTMQIGTYNRIHPRSNLRNILRTLGYDFQEAINYSKQLPDMFQIVGKKTSGKMEDIMASLSDDLEALMKKDKRIAPLMNKFDGLVQSMGTHAGGVLIGDGSLDLRTLIPTTKVKEESEHVSQFDKKAIEKKLGVVKFDILGLSTLQTIAECRRLIGRDIFKNFPHDTNLDDKATFDIINRGLLTYIFQLDGYACRACIKTIDGIADFEEIVSVTSIARPGPMKFIPLYAENKKMGTETKYVHKDLIPILKSTNGIILLQEQVMSIAREIAGFTMIQVDDIKEMIKAKSHGEFNALQEPFIKGAMKKGYKRKISEDIWELIDGSAGYLYNRSHAVSYSLITYQTAYLKAHYPVEFITACMNLEKPDKDKVKALVKEAHSMGIKILRPDIHKSGVYAIVEKDAVRLGLSQIKGMGKTTATNIVETRNSDGIKAVYALDKRTMRTNVIAALRDTGAFGKSKMKKNRQLELLGFSVDDPLAEYREEIIKFQSDSSSNKTFGGIVTRVKKITTKNNDAMAFAEITFDTVSEDVVLFPSVWEEYKDTFKEGNVVLVFGSKQRGRSGVVMEGVKLLS